MRWQPLAWIFLSGLACVFSAPRGMALEAALSSEGTKSEAATAKVGQKAPVFVLKAENDQSVDLRLFRGRWVVLAFYPADFTSGCTAEVCALRDEKETVEALNARIFGISVQDVKSKKGFAKENRLNFRLLADETKEVSKRYGTLASPNGVSKRQTFYIDPYGVIRKIDDQVRPLSAGKDLLDNLKTLQRNDPPVVSDVWDKGIARWSKTVKENPDDTEARLELATAYYMKGRAFMLTRAFPEKVRNTAARQMLARALEYEPNLAAAKEDLESLKD